MKRLVVMFGLVACCSAPAAQAGPISLSGTLGGVDSNTVKDDGDGNHDFAIDRSAAGTFYFSAGSPVTITGTVDVRGLTSGSYLQIGLVDKQQADLSLDTYGWGGYMFNNSAIATFYAGTRNYARLADTNDLYSAQLFNPAGNTPGVFEFALGIAGDGSMGLTLLGSTAVSQTYSYGHRNWWDGWSGWSGGELAGGSYLVAQLWIDTGNTSDRVFATYDITGTNAVPEPGSLWLLGSALAGFAGYARRRRTR